MLLTKCTRSLFFGLSQHRVSLMSSILSTIIQRGIRMSVINMNHYKALGLSANATQNDIKTAYYKLSMLYHPDKNKGSDDAARKFREITAAYEVLGNLRLRRLYDKGILHTAGQQYGSEPHFEEDDAQTKFYKAREKRANVPQSDGKTPIYDFDEWSRLHYGSSFDRKQKAKKRYEFSEALKRDNKLKSQNEILFFVILAGVVLLNIFMMKNYDKDNTKRRSEDR